MDIGIISVRYARALLKEALRLHIETDVYENMQKLFNAYLKLPALRKAMSSPTTPKQTKQELLLTACGTDASELIKRFVKLVVDETRETFMQFIAGAYITLYRRNKNIISGKLITASSVSNKIEQKMADMIKERTHGTVEFQTEVDPEILGGFILEYDTYRMDASVKNQLNRILTALKN